MRFARLVPGVLLAILTLCTSIGAHAAPKDGLPTPQSVTPIVNGVEEAGWPAVGALTMEVIGIGYMGSFCSGTLIAPQWVMSAGHCLYPSDDLPISPELVRFYIGSDANMVGWGELPVGQFHQADAFFVHPDYDPVMTRNDISLMHLSKPVEGVTPIPINTLAMDDSWVGNQILYVGFGVDDGIEQTGGGVKRSGTMPIEGLHWSVYYSIYDGAGVCFGDSGGPGLWEVDGQWSVVGVNSAVYSETGDPCSGMAIQTRVDLFAPWIESHVLGEQPSCHDTPELCWCDAGCQEDGSCNNELCKTESCLTVYNCLDACNGDTQCRARCYVSANETAVATLQELVYCWYLQCGYHQDETCKETACQDILGKCIPLEHGDATCEETFACLAGCDPHADQCILDCHNAASEDAAQQRVDLMECYDKYCMNSDIEVSYRFNCGWEHCARELETCFPPAECDLAGGDCGTGQACFPNPLNKTDCFPSRDVAGEQPCAIDAIEPLECQDGFACSGMGGDPVCMKLCYKDADCENGGTCVSPIWSGIEGVGVCLCTDADGDGVCSRLDCRDDNKGIHPGAEELCDGQDNNCDGVVDEGCETTTEDVVSQEDIEDDSKAEGTIPTLPNGGSGNCSQGSAPSTSSLLVVLMALLGLVVLRPRKN